MALLFFNGSLLTFMLSTQKQEIEVERYAASASEIEGQWLWINFPPYVTEQ